jgi:hypothetical protein
MLKIEFIKRTPSQNNNSLNNANKHNNNTMKQTKQSKQYYLDLVDDEDDQQQYNAGEVAYDDFSAESTTAIKSGNTPANKNDGLVYRSKHVRAIENRKSDTKKNIKQVIVLK